MIRNVQIAESANAYIKDTGLNDNHKHIAYDGFEAGAKWADQSMRDRAAGWLGGMMHEEHHGARNVLVVDYERGKDDFIELFRLAMGEWL